MPHTEVPEVALPFAIFSMCILVLLALSARLWHQGMMRWTAGRAVLPQPEPRRMQCWGFVDLVFAFFAVVGLQMLAAATGTWLHIAPPRATDGELDLRMIAWISTIQSLAILVVTVFISLRCHVRPITIGWSLARWFSDLRLGINAFIVLAPPVYMLMMAVTWLSGQDYKHPIHEMAGKDPWLLVPAIFMAVVLAPLGEEFAFRVLLQGFLESLSVGRFSIEKFFVGRAGDEIGLQDNRVDQNSLPYSLNTSEVRFAHQENPYGYVDAHPEPSMLSENVGTSFNDDSLDEQYGFEASSDMPEEIQSGPTLPWWPIIASGILFGLAHFEYGMSWIPLTVLGIALGWLYRVTNRIWPSLVVHMCVNATSMIGFSLTVLFGDPTKAIP